MDLRVQKLKVGSLSYVPPPQTKLHQICIISLTEGIYLFPIKQCCFLKFIPSPESGRRLCYVNGFIVAFYRMNLTLVFEVYVNVAYHLW